MTPRDVLRGAGWLTVLEGLGLTIGGRSAINLAGRLAPPWFGSWLRPLAASPSLAVRLLGAMEVGLGLRILAMTPPVPDPLRDLALAAVEPFLVIWRARVGRGAERAFDNYLCTVVPPGARVLDLGCDWGDNLARLIANHLPFGSYVGVDRSPMALARARARFADLRKVAFLRNDLLNEQLPTGEFDLILATWTIARLPDPLDLLVRALRQLRHGGHAIVLYASPGRDSRSGWVRQLATRLGWHLRPPDLYVGLPCLASTETFDDGSSTLVVLEKPAAPRVEVAESSPE